MKSQEGHFSGNISRGKISRKQTVRAGRSKSSPSSPPTGPDLPAALAQPFEKGGEIRILKWARKNLAEAASDLCWEGGGEKSGATIPTSAAENSFDNCFQTSPAECCKG